MWLFEKHKIATVQCGASQWGLHMVEDIVHHTECCITCQFLSCECLNALHVCSSGRSMGSEVDLRSWLKVVECQNGLQLCLILRSVCCEKALKGLKTRLFLKKLPHPHGKLNWKLIPHWESNVAPPTKNRVYLSKAGLNTHTLYWRLRILAHTQ